MRLLIDDEIFFRQPFGGVSKIFFELLKSAEKRDDVSLLFENLYSENAYLKTLNKSKLAPFLESYSFPLKGKIIRAIAGFEGHRYVKKHLLEDTKLVFHPSFYSAYYLPYLKDTNKQKLVFTVHDLIHEKFGKTAHYKSIAAYKKVNLERADRIIAVSENTRNDLQSIYPFVDPKKIVVIPLAQSISDVAAKTIEDIPEEYILYTGERAEYKNFGILLEAFKLISNEYPKLFLFCTGSNGFSRAEKRMLAANGLENRVKQKKLSIAELKTAYIQAKAFVFPSLYEGFGIPVLEAFACGCPVLISNCGSLPEVAGAAALSFNPKDAKELASSLRELLNNKELRKELVEKGKRREKEFSWQKHVERTFAVYQELWEELGRERF